MSLTFMIVEPELVWFEAEFELVVLVVGTVIFGV